MPNAEQLTGYLRTLLAAVGGYVVAKGYTDAATATTVSGAIVVIVMAVWSHYTNKPGTIIPPTDKTVIVATAPTGEKTTVTSTGVVK